MSNETNDGWTEVTAKDKLENLKSIVFECNPWIDDDQALIAVYLYAANNYSGQGDPLDKITWLIDFRFNGGESHLKEEYPNAFYAARSLETLLNQKPYPTL
jgi:hypothetical protein